MKPIIFCLAVILSTVLTGCSTNKPDSVAVIAPEQKLNADVRQEPEPKIFLIGLKTQQVEISYTKGLTFTGAITRAGGIVEFASQSFYLVRCGKPTKVSFDDALQDKAKDISLEPWDIIYLPRRKF
jgi:hypothetical protein